MLNIESLLGQIPKELADRKKKKREMQKLFQTYGQELVVYGHGNLGIELEKGLENADWPVRCFLDAKKPTDLSQKNINLKDAKQYLSENAIIIVALYDIFTEYPSIQRNLKEKGFQNIFSILDLRVWPELFQAGHMHSTIGWDIEHIPQEQVVKAHSLLADPISQKTFMELLHFMVSSPYEKLTLYPPTEQYMPAEIYTLIKDERIVDCGAYDGDTMRMFLSKIGSWQSYTALDADPYNVGKVKESILRDLPDYLQDVTQAVHAAVSNEAANASFFARSHTSSYVSTAEGEDGESILVPVVKLDDVIQEPVTLVKMDVEGFELRALQGAEGLIQKNQPLLAICGYHRQTDLWELPIYMNKLLPNHKIYLRNYVGIIEYVFYAVPQDRVRSK